MLSDGATAIFTCSMQASPMVIPVKVTAWLHTSESGLYSPQNLKNMTKISHRPGTDTATPALHFETFYLRHLIPFVYSLLVMKP